MCVRYYCMKKFGGVEDNLYLCIVITIIGGNLKTRNKVKRQFFVSILLAGIMAMTTGCASDDTSNDGLNIEFSTIPIAFGGEGKPLSLDDESDVTRGTAYGSSWGTATGSNMDVWAYHYQPNSTTPIGLMREQRVTYDSPYWVYTPIIFWPKEGTADFYAYAPACYGARREFETFTPSHINYQALLMNCHVPASQITTIHTLGTANGYVSTVKPHDAANQYDLMFAFNRDMICSEQSVSDVVNFKFVHAMAGLRLMVATDGYALNIPSDAAKMIVGVGRLKTGGTLAICEPNALGGYPEVEWTLDGLEGTFYETYNIIDNPDTPGQKIISRERTVDVPDDQGDFFFPPQKLENGITVSLYFYDEDNKRIDYRVANVSKSKIGELPRGTITTLKLGSAH